MTIDEMVRYIVHMVISINSRRDLIVFGYETELSDQELRISEYAISEPNSWEI